MGVYTLVDTDKEVQPIEKQIQCIETTPQSNWVDESQDEEGHPIYYTNVRITGLWPRRYGPFESYQAALLFLEDTLDPVLDTLLEVENLAREQMVRGPACLAREG